MNIEMVVEAQAPVLLVSVFGRIISGAFATVNHFEYFKLELMPETNTIVCAKKQKPVFVNCLHTLCSPARIIQGVQKYWN